MREFFRGWRRKGGVITLVMAVVLTSVWIRGEFAPISIKFQIGPRQHRLTTNTGRLIWVSADKVKGMGLLEEENSSTGLPNERTRTVLLHSLVMVLTLLSAYLILWKPRTRSA